MGKYGRLLGTMLRALAAGAVKAGMEFCQQIVRFVHTVV